MTSESPDRERHIRTRILVWLTLYAIAMAYVEAALVVHLRQLYYADNLLTIFPLRLLSHADLVIELNAAGIDT